MLESPGPTRLVIPVATSQRLPTRRRTSSNSRARRCLAEGLYRGGLRTNRKRHLGHPHRDRVRAARSRSRASTRLQPRQDEQQPEGRRDERERERRGQPDVVVEEHVESLIGSLRRTPHGVCPCCLNQILCAVQGAAHQDRAARQCDPARSHVRGSPLPCPRCLSVCPLMETT